MSRIHVAVSGDCVESIAFAYGHFPKTLADDPANHELLQARGDLHTLLPGDEVVVPDLRPKVVSCSTGKRHLFRRRGVPARLRIVLDDPRPPAGTAYEIAIDGAQPITGKLAEDGLVDVWIAPGASSAKLAVAGRTYALQLGKLPPIATLEGVIARLRNLRYLRGPSPADENAANLIRAIADFQTEQKLPVDGTISDALREKLVSVHGS